METYVALANLVLAFHMLWAFGMIAICIAALRWGGLLPYAGFMAMSTATAQVAFGGRCPLTLLEIALRSRNNRYEVHEDTSTAQLIGGLFNITNPELRIVVAILCIAGFWALVHLPFAVVAARKKEPLGTRA